MGDTHSSSSDAYTTSTAGDAWAADAARLGKVGSQRLLAVETVTPPAYVGEALRLSTGERAICRRRLILADDRPVEIATSYYPAAIASGTPLADTKKIKGGAIHALTQLGHPLDESVDVVTAERPTAADIELLDVSQDEPIIVIRRTSGPTGGEPVEFAENRMVASRTEPLFYRTRTGGE